MPVRVVARDPVAQPEHAVDPQILAQLRFELLARQTGIARLNRAEQTFLGRQQHARAIDIDAAALEHAVRIHQPGTPARCGMARPAASSAKWFSYFAQPLKRHLTAATIARGTADKHRREIPRPDPIGSTRWNSTAPICAPTMRSTLRADCSIASSSHQNAHSFHLRKLADDLAHTPTGSAQNAPASLRRCAAMRSMWLRAAPTPPAWNRVGRVTRETGW